MLRQLTVMMQRLLFAGISYGLLLGLDVLDLDLGVGIVSDDVFLVLVGIPRQSDNGGGIESVPLWIILLSVAIGLVVVVCITFTLWKLGFFRRNRLSDDVMISAKIMHSNSCGVAQYHDREDEYMS